MRDKFVEWCYRVWDFFSHVGERVTRELTLRDIGLATLALLLAALWILTLPNTP